MRVPGIDWHGFAQRLRQETESRSMAPGAVCSQCGITYRAVHGLLLGIGSASVSVVAYLAVCKWANINPLEYFREFIEPTRRHMSQADGHGDSRLPGAADQSEPR